MIMISEAFVTWLKGRKPSYELFKEFYAHIIRKVMNDEITITGSTSKILRMKYSKEKGLTKIDKMIEEYWKIMRKDGSYREAFWYIYVTPEQRRQKDNVNGVGYV